MSNTFTPTEVQLPANAIGWVNLSIANTYLNSRYQDIKYWDNDTPSTSEKEAALWLAYYNIVSSNKFRFNSNSKITDWLQKAQCEQALYIIQQGQAREARMALQSQNVTRADVVKEYYRANSAYIDISVAAAALLRDYRVDQGWGTIERLDTRD